MLPTFCEGQMKYRVKMTLAIVVDIEADDKEHAVAIAMDEANILGAVAKEMCHIENHVEVSAGDDKWVLEHNPVVKEVLHRRKVNGKYEVVLPADSGY